MHCHFLKHEDLGMMDTFYIHSGDPTTAPTSAPATTETTAPTPAPTASESTDDTVEACASGNDDTGEPCPPDTTNGVCPAGCEVESLLEDVWVERVEPSLRSAPVSPRSLLPQGSRRSYQVVNK